ncbi:hypothetical protein [Candidatus Halobonum tyrrellensis]|uniref:Membrane-bound metal-dependent hydrolase n=1 Tax=Candidatus Halobonum tyrrellensis G22 TaxID=1324957 RepID=V4H9F4_9EURY|nr:hypothetical protein [Candidatus Halobonum tyrrellensis]ESP87305.1 hypothetical protein K933_14503 [Candidatus Halobonum tyrrellensis G22]
MMATTHALAGVLVGMGALAVVPEAGPAVLLAGALGGAAPDLDLLWAHRRTLHFPVVFAAFAAVAAALAWAAPGTATVAAAAFSAAAALHAASDALGGGLELRPWEATSDRGVYDHVRRRWVAPRRWVRYDGAPEDFLLGLALALPAFAALDGPARWAVVGLVGVSGVYTAGRKAMVDGGERLVRRLPPRLLRLIPETLIEDLR